jgi:Tfp pilus assembly protein PilZ
MLQIRKTLSCAINKKKILYASFYMAHNEGGGATFIVTVKNELYSLDVH